MVKITVPVESDDPTNHAGLEKLHDLLLDPISATLDVQCFFYLTVCQEHEWAGHREESVSVATLKKTIQILAQKAEIIGECQQCPMEDEGLGWIKSENSLYYDAQAIEENARESCGGLIGECVIVGNGRPSPALFVELAEGVEMDEAQARREIIRRTRHFHARRYLHARITSAKMIKVVPRGSLPRTATKGNVRRRAVEEKYKAELDAMFASA